MNFAHLRFNFHIFGLHWLKESGHQIHLHKSVWHKESSELSIVANIAVSIIVQTKNSRFAKRWEEGEIPGINTFEEFR